MPMGDMEDMKDLENQKKKNWLKTPKESRTQYR